MKYELKEDVTVARSRAGGVGCKCRDFGKGAGIKIKSIIYAVYRTSCLLG